MSLSAFFTIFFSVLIGTLIGARRVLEEAQV